VDATEGRQVVALLVSHDGARWLPTVLDGLRSQTVPPVAVVGVDTGSKDDSVALVEAAFGQVVEAGSGIGFPAAVRRGLEAVDTLAAARDAEWVWLLHDDSTPAPDALEALLSAASADPGADILGPKLREWPSLRRLLEIGVTISGTGRRETGLERGEYDQGQHDEQRTVLAVNTAGMLVRRSVLEQLGGFDDQLAVFGNDVDFGWRAASAGHRTIVVPQAVVFHAEAAHRGIRRTPLTGRHTHYQERRAALYTLLVNSSAASLPWRVVRLGLGTLLRVLGFVLVRSVGEALDELAALVSLYGSPRQVLAARRQRRERLAGRAPDKAAVRRLLAPWWLPYRHGLDTVGDIVSAATQQAQDVAERRRAAAAAAEAAAHPTPTRRRATIEDEEGPAEDTGLVARFLTSPVALGLAVFVVLALVGARAAVGPVSGGGLSVAPASVGLLWDLHLDHWHPLAQGTAAPAPPYVLPVALLATLLGGSAVAAVSVLLVLAVPLALWGAWRFLRVVGHLSDAAGAPRWLLAVASSAYALVPVVSGAWGEGRLGVVVAAAALPWLAHAALGFADPEPDRRWRAAWRAGLLLTLVTAFTAAAWVFAVLLGVVLVATGFVIAPRAMRDRSVWGPPAVALASVPVLLSPWWVPLLAQGHAGNLLLDIGRLPDPVLGFHDLLSGRLGGEAAPAWLGLLTVAFGVLALLPGRSRIPVLVVWVAGLVAAATALMLGALRFDVPFDAGPASGRPGLGFFLVALQGVFVVAAFVAVHGLATRARRSAGSVRRLVPGVLTLVAAVVPVGGLAWFVATGPADLDDSRDADIPAYMVQASLEGPAHGVLVIRGSVAEGLTYSVRRGDGVTLGDDEILAATPADPDLDAAVSALTSRPRAAVMARLAEQGIQYVVLPAPADPTVAAGLDAAGGLDQASAENRATRAWQVTRPVDEHALDGPTSWWRTALLVAQGVAIVVVLVLCVPTTRPRREATP